MSVIGKSWRSEAEYVIRQIIEAYSEEAEMPQEMCTNGFGEAKRRVQELRLTKGEERADECERQNVTESYF